jgi:hypothetical protein
LLTMPSRPMAPSGQDASSSSARRRVGCRPRRRSRGVGIREARRAMPWLYKPPAHGPASSFFGFVAQCVRPERSSNGLLRGGNAAVLLPPPALGERRHRSLARCLVAVGRALDVAIMPARPHPGRSAGSAGDRKMRPTTIAFSSKWRRFNAEMLARVGRRPSTQNQQARCVGHRGRAE